VICFSLFFNFLSAIFELGNKRVFNLVKVFSF